MEKENIWFCAHLCSAANKLGYVIIKESDGAYSWLDLYALEKIRCEAGKTKEESLVISCKTLQNHLCPPTYQRT